MQGRAFVREMSRLEFFSWETRWSREDFIDICKGSKTMKEANKQAKKYKHKNLPKVNQRSSLPQETMKAKRWHGFKNWINKGLLSTKLLSLITGRRESAPGKHHFALAWPLYSSLGTCYCLMSKKRYWALWADRIWLYSRANEISTVPIMERALRVWPKAWSAR